MSAPLVFPLGHYLGPNRDAPTSVADEPHLLRIGWHLYRLDEVDQLGVWALAHGIPDDATSAPWTRAATEGAARAAGIATAPGILAELLERDLLVEVEPGTTEAARFARECRMRALLTGLGESADGSGRSAIGFAGHPLVHVDAFTYELWTWAPACDSLWHACEITARAEGGTSTGDVTDVLTRALASLQLLVAHGAAFMDEARS